MKSIAAILLVFLAGTCNGFGVGDKPSSPQISTSTMSRSNFLAAVVGGVAVSTCGAAPSWAKDDPSIKGTKKDPAFEACLSQYMYDCTKPKGAEQKSRVECLSECKKQCATNKSQLLRGEPVKPSE